MLKIQFIIVFKPQMPINYILLPIDVMITDWLLPTAYDYYAHFLPFFIGHYYKNMIPRI